MPRRRLVALAVVALLSIAIAGIPVGARAATADGQFARKGIWFKTCAEYVKARGDQSKLYYMFVGWVDGYITAINQYANDTFDVTFFETSELLAALLDSNCRRNPEAQFFVAVDALTRAIINNRLQEPSPVVEASAGGQTVKLYAEALRRAQEALAKRGYFSGSADGAFTPETRSAFEAFQKAENMTTTGLPDQLTLLRLFRQKPKAP